MEMPKDLESLKSIKGFCEDYLNVVISDKSTNTTRYLCVRLSDYTKREMIIGLPKTYVQFRIDEVLSGHNTFSQVISKGKSPTEKDCRLGQELRVKFVTNMLAEVNKVLEELS